MNLLWTHVYLIKTSAGIVCHAVLEASVIAATGLAGSDFIRVKRINGRTEGGCQLPNGVNKGNIYQIKVAQ